MEKPLPLLLLLLLLLLLASPFRPLLPSAAISDDELEAAIYSLQSQGYHLFGNAITSSDVRFDLLSSNDSFTLFAPTDAALFSLDMLFSASAFIGALRHHVALGRHSLPALRALIPGSSLRTLFHSREIVVSYRDSVDLVTVDGVDVVLPGLFYGQTIAVHGLAGILPQRNLHPSETPHVLRSKDSHYASANSPDLSSQMSKHADPKDRRKLKRGNVANLAPMSAHSQIYGSEFSYPPRQSQIRPSSSDSPEISPSQTPADRSRSILISPAMDLIENGDSDCSSTAAPATFSAYGTCRNAENLSAPTNDSPNPNV